MTYARICVYMDLSKDLLEAVSLNWDDEEWIQQIDYEKLPFRCRICHEYGHFGRNCPKGIQEKSTPDQEGESQANDGFTQVKNRSRGRSNKGHKLRKEMAGKPLVSSNNFHVLGEEGEDKSKE